MGRRSSTSAVRRQLHVLVVDHPATRNGLDHLLAGRDLEEVMSSTTAVRRQLHVLVVDHRGRHSFGGTRVGRTNCVEWERSSRVLDAGGRKRDEGCT